MTAVPPPLTPAEIEQQYRQAQFIGDYAVGDRNGLATLTDTMLARMPAEELPNALMPLVQSLVATGNDAPVREFARAVQRAVVAMSPEDNLGEMLKGAARFHAGHGGEDAMRAYWRDFLAAQAQPFIEGVNRGYGQRPSVVFVVHEVNYKVLREALYLRRNGFQCAMISLVNYPPEVQRVFDAAVPIRITVPNNLALLGQLIGALKVDIIHVHCSMQWYSHGRIAIENRGDARVVCEFADIGSVYAPRDVMVTRFPAAVIDFDLAMERFVCNHADGLIHQWSPAIEAELRQRHGALPPAIEMQPYACPDFVRYSDDKLSQHDGIIRFVYAGNACQVSDATPPALFPGRFLPETAEALCEQGFALDVLQDPSKFHTFWDPEERYARVGRRYPRFQMKKGVEPQALSAAICRYDYGMLLLKVDWSATHILPVKLKCQVANKFYAYLEAGLPVVVSAEFEYMAELVQKHGIGLAVPVAEIDHLRARLEAVDYAAMAANVRRYNEEFAMERQITRLIDLYQRISTKRAAAE